MRPEPRRQLAEVQAAPTCPAARPACGASPREASLSRTREAQSFPSTHRSSGGSPDALSSEDAHTQDSAIQRHLLQEAPLHLPGSPTEPRTSSLVRDPKKGAEATLPCMSCLGTRGPMPTRPTSANVNASRPVSPPSRPCCPSLRARDSGTRPPPTERLLAAPLPPRLLAVKARAPGPPHPGLGHLVPQPLCGKVPERPAGGGPPV